MLVTHESRTLPGCVQNWTTSPLNFCCILCSMKRRSFIGTLIALVGIGRSKPDVVRQTDNVVGSVAKKQWVPTHYEPGQLITADMLNRHIRDIHDHIGDV